MSRRKKSCGEPHGCSLSRLCTDVETTLVCHSGIMGKYELCFSFGVASVLVPIIHPVLQRLGTLGF